MAPVGVAPAVDAKRYVVDDESNTDRFKVKPNGMRRIGIARRFSAYGADHSEAGRGVSGSREASRGVSYGLPVLRD